MSRIPYEAECQATFVLLIAWAYLLSNFCGELRKTPCYSCLGQRSQHVFFGFIRLLVFELEARA